MKLPLLSAEDLIKILSRMGFETVRQRGSHKRLKHADGRVTVVPVHSNTKIGRGLLRRILREIEVDRNEFLKYM